MSDFIFNPPLPRDPQDAAELPRVTYFTLEAHDDCTLVPLEDADEYSIHIGLPDRPDRRQAWKFDYLEDALTALEDLRRAYPQATMWLSTEYIQTEMLGDTAWEGIVHAQAEIDEDDEDCEWVRVSRLITRADADQIPLRKLLKEWLGGHDVSDMVGTVIDHL
jgi:hypothetical protein